MSDLAHAIQFFQTGITILLGLALGEAFKQLVPDGDQDIRSDRVASLMAFLFMIFPFFHGMSRYFYTNYLTHSEAKLGPVAGHIMFDGSVFMTIAVLFFVLCRSLSPNHWIRFYTFLLALLAVDTVWIVVSMIFGAPLLSWLILNIILAGLLLVTLRTFWPQQPYDDNNKPPMAPGWLCALYTFSTTLLSYLWMSDFYFPS
jgi:hypothetical protein